jgi:16S rRNA C1402 (ribose-2'-O) methylase RsmI
MENFPKTLETPKPIFIDQSPAISKKKPTHQDNSLSTPKLTKKTLKLINKISPRTPEKFLLNNLSKKSDQIKTNQPLELIVNKRQRPTEKEFILLQQIKVLKKQLSQAQQLVQQEKQRADQAEQQLKQIGYRQQLEQEQKEAKAQIIQPLPLKVK